MLKKTNNLRTSALQQSEEAYEDPAADDFLDFQVISDTEEDQSPRLQSSKVDLPVEEVEEVDDIELEEDEGRQDEETEAEGRQDEETEAEDGGNEAGPK